VNLIDTADAYGPGISERLIAEALRLYPADLVIAKKEVKPSSLAHVEENLGAVSATTRWTHSTGTAPQKLTHYAGDSRPSIADPRVLGQGS
jgi:hypothetical protein